MNGSLKVQTGSRFVSFQLPHRVIFGRRHTTREPRPIGETHQVLSQDLAMSREWFGVEDVSVVPAVPGAEEVEALMVTCRSTTNSVQVWDGADPVRLPPGARYLAQGDVLFIGDLLGGHIVGARVERMLFPEAIADEVRADADVSQGRTVRPLMLAFTPLAQDVLMARYHRYYRTPPDFDPQPVPWADVAVRLGLLTLAQAADNSAVRVATRPAQDAVSAVKKLVDKHYPGWLPAGSETQKTFHDHLRTVLEMRGFFTPELLAAFDAEVPRPHGYGRS